MNDHEKNIEMMKELRNRIDEVLKDRPSDIGIALTDPMGIPDPVKHKYISFVKSGVRIVAGLALGLVGLNLGNPVLQGAGLLLVLAEILGIIEEMV